MITCTFKKDGHCIGQKLMPECDSNPDECSVLKDSGVQVSKIITKQLNMVDHPAHYNTGGVECIEALAAATSGLEGIEAFCTANAIKYLWRWKWKNGVEDLDKATWYINYLKAHMAKNN